MSQLVINGASAPVLAIGETVIRQHDGLFCLNDLHEVFGGKLRHKPTSFTGRSWTKTKIAKNKWSLKTLTGIYGGSYGCKNLALAYVSWIDPSLRLKALPLLWGAKTPESAQVTEQEEKPRRGGYPAIRKTPESVPADLCDAKTRESTQPASRRVAPVFAIGETVIRQRDGLFSLNDLHSASGGEYRNKPKCFLRNRSTKTKIAKKNWSVSIFYGTSGGTYACRELAIDYAAWIDPAFHQAVLRMFGVEAAQPPARQVAPSPTIENTEHADILYKLVCAKTQESRIGRHWLWAALNAHFGLKGYRNLPLSRIDEAYAFVQSAVLPSIQVNPAPKPLPAPAPEAPTSLRDALLLAADLESKRQEAESRAAVKPAPATLREALLLALALAEKQTKALALAEKQKDASKFSGTNAPAVPDADDPQKWASLTDMRRVSSLRPSAVLLRRASQKLGIPIRWSYTKWGNKQNLYHAKVWKTCYDLEIPEMEARHEPRP
ncbi:MAG: KilA-N domain-containing protein [Zoogloeaceae bacterium]|jgi:hypothetical protein|nr:KilA-N domain-containing protein [Zoogloeaceae bacterium]